MLVFITPRKSYARPRPESTSLGWRTQDMRLWTCCVVELFFVRPKRLRRPREIEAWGNREQETTPKFLTFSLVTFETARLLDTFIPMVHVMLHNSRLRSRIVSLFGVPERGNYRETRLKSSAPFGLCTFRPRPRVTFSGCNEYKHNGLGNSSYFGSVLLHQFWWIFHSNKKKVAILPSFRFSRKREGPNQI